MFFPYHDDNPTRRAPFVTIGLIAVNAVAFLGTSLVGPQEQLELIYRWAFVPARVAQLWSGEAIEVAAPREEPALGELPPPGLIVRYGPSRLDVIVTLFTSMFLHGSFMHLLGNMWFLWLFGNNVEDRVGHGAYLLFYLAGGLVAAMCHWLTDTNSEVPVIGASGAVSAVLGAYAVTWPHAHIRTFVFLFVFITTIRLPALLVLGFWFLQQLLEGSLNLGMEGGVAWWAHVGGFVAGAAAMKPLCALVAPLEPPPRRERPPLDWT